MMIMINATSRIRMIIMMMLSSNTRAIVAIIKIQAEIIIRIIKIITAIRYVIIT